MTTSARTLEEQREEFTQRRLIATPLAGLCAWTIVAVGSLFLPPVAISLLLFGATGSIIYLALFISRFTGENFLAKDRPRNTFDALFFYTMAMAVLVYAIAIPFFLRDYTSLPLTVGILTGLMWLPTTWIIGHWVGVAHAVGRTAAIVVAWYLFPEHRFTAVSLVIILAYVLTIPVLELRWRRLHTSVSANPAGPT
ncbi:MAG: hypothetical protein LBF16_11490 [Pseudomonadales bacterium]|jgi:hypothetical protein|nr:hypothetical protein [Pseudomonadales bacterium]